MNAPSMIVGARFTFKGELMVRKNSVQRWPACAVFLAALATACGGAGEASEDSPLVGDWEAYKDGVVDLTMHFSGDGTYSREFPSEPDAAFMGTYTAADGVLSLDATNSSGAHLTFDGPFYAAAGHFTNRGLYPDGEHDGITGVWVSEYSSSLEVPGIPPMAASTERVITILP
ncbi:MAG TPA: hypothetical protein VFG83_05615, partial [Kofleriaceae bacterium]|nr:hypothetical protein [Kofleriaceae bacterium]